MRVHGKNGPISRGLPHITTATAVAAALSASLLLNIGPALANDGGDDIAMQMQHTRNPFARQQAQPFSYYDEQWFESEFDDAALHPWAYGYQQPTPGAAMPFIQHRYYDDQWHEDAFDEPGFRQREWASQDPFGDFFGYFPPDPFEFESPYGSVSPFTTRPNAYYSDDWHEDLMLQPD